MSYVTSHHGSLYFQIRVPVPLQPRLGKVVRVNLQTRDPSVARALALRLASDWLTRFQTEHLLSAPLESSNEGWPVETPEASDPDIAASAPPTAASTAPAGRKSLQPKSDKVTDQMLFEAWRRLDTERESTTVRDMKAAIKAFRQSCKTPMQELTRQDVAGFRDQLLKKRLARATVSKKVGFISTLLQVGYDGGLLPQNVARGLKIPRAEVPTLIRRSFTPAELARLFSSSIYTAPHRPIAGCGEACLWIPMIALTTGARLEEIAQLRIDDIIADPELGPLMRITDEDEDQGLKTDGSRRTIPLHPAFIETRFLDYVERVRDAKLEWVFPQLEPDHDGRRGGNFGKWFMRYMRSSQGPGIRDPRVVFHSFRHTFKTMCREAGLTEEIHDALTGHVSGAVSRKYGEMPLRPLVAAVHSIKVPVTLPRIEEGVAK